MKNVFYVSFAFAAFLLLSDAPAWAQADEESHIYVVTTWKTVMPDDGTAAARDSLTALYADNVVKKNELIVSERNMRHLMGSDLRDWVVITEYRNWNDIDAAADRSNELFQEYWDTPEKRREFNRAFFTYFGTHSDELYTDLPQFAK